MRLVDVDPHQAGSCRVEDLEVERRLPVDGGQGLLDSDAVPRDLGRGQPEAGGERLDVRGLEAVDLDQRHPLTGTVQAGGGQRVKAIGGAVLVGRETAAGQTARAPEAAPPRGW